MVNYRKKTFIILSLLLITALCVSLAGCDLDAGSDTNETKVAGQDSEKSSENNSKENPKGKTKEYKGRIKLSKIPKWKGRPSVEINNDDPLFTKAQLKRIRIMRHEKLSSLDRYGRCGTVMACIKRSTMPDGQRGSIGMVKPAGWHTVRYDFVDGQYLYNRCHLIGWQLTGLNAEERNLITGTRYMNVDGMLPYENEVAEYVENTGNPVAYRVTPIYKGSELIARGVQMEAESIKDKGKDLSFNVYCYNVQPNVSIDYATGDSKLKSNAPGNTTDSAAGSKSNRSHGDSAKAKYVLNKNTMKFHKKTCGSVSMMKPKNRIYFKGSRKEVLNMGYDPCLNCNP